jgi:hypothetical protein
MSQQPKPPLQQQSLMSEREQATSVGRLAFLLPYQPALRRISKLSLFYLFGPMPARACVLRDKAAGSTWQARQRWQRLSGSALLSLVWYLPVMVFAGPLATLWTSIFSAVANALHLPWLAYFGGTAIWLPLPSSMFLRWVLAYPLAGIVACGIEMIHPRTRWESKRVITPDEQLELAAQESKRRKIERQTHTRSTNTKEDAQISTPRPKRARAPRAEVPPGPSQVHPNSLWAKIDWNTVSESDPLKQEAEKEAAARAAEEQREEERNRFLRQQQAWLSQEATRRGAAQKASRQASANPSPSPSAPPTQPEDEYNWDVGEGTIQE